MQELVGIIPAGDVDLAEECSAGSEVQLRLREFRVRLTIGRAAHQGVCAARRTSRDLMSGAFRDSCVSR